MIQRLLLFLGIESIHWTKEKYTILEGTKPFHQTILTCLFNSLNEMQALQQWNPDEVLYFGDHVYNDILRPSNLGWKTGTVIKEIEHEVFVQNSPNYRSCLAELLEVERVIKYMQIMPASSKRSAILDPFQERRYLLRGALRDMINPWFGSSFRTHTSSTLYAFNVKLLFLILLIF